MIRYLRVGKHDIPIKVIPEWRGSTRVSLGKDHVILRVPKSLWSDNVQSHLAWAAQWLHQIQYKKPNALLRYVAHKTYQNGNDLNIGGENFILQIEEAPGDTAKIRREQNILRLFIPVHPDLDRQKVIKKLLVKFACAYFLPTLKKRVNELNTEHFQQSFQGIKLKYNTSNWGSCSHGRNLNFSVRLFLAPPQVLDYVIVHELAHLLEMNHSSRFWNLVAKAQPEYKKWERLLKVNSHEYDF